MTPLARARGENRLHDRRLNNVLNLHINTVFIKSKAKYQKKSSLMLLYAQFMHFITGEMLKIDLYMKIIYLFNRFDDEARFHACINSNKSNNYEKKKI